MNINTNILLRIVKNSFILLVLIVIVQCVFAVSGIRVRSSDKDKNKTEQRDAGVFSDLKSTITFSIKDNYSFNQKNFGKKEHKAFPEPKHPTSIISYKKGNTVYMLPYKPQAGLKLPGFISMSPSEPISR